MTRWDDLVEAHRVACGERLAKARVNAGLSTYQVAHAIGIPTGRCNVITRYEDGTLPGLARMYELADVLGVSVDDIWGFHE